MNPVIGRVPYKIGGEVREFACDMRCVAVLWDEVGDDWATWLTERFAGTLMPMEDGTERRVAAQIPEADLGIALYALLASDRAKRPRIETPEDILRKLFKDQKVDAQVAAMDAIAPSFGIRGKGLEPERKRKRKKKAQPWDWRLILETALGLMGLAPDVFWGMTLAEWRAMHDGYAARQKRDMRNAAWALSYQLTAAGCDPDKVTPAKLLGETTKADREHKRKVREAIEKAKSAPGPNLEMLKLAHAATGGKVGADLIAQAEG
ncbi:MAG TPA: phage tail assembly chaperone [Candidatus Aquilonibacter sp.]|nr:phage tail assembly chaperone [Candidatus Aquilonibacter sp.]